MHILNFGPRHTWVVNFTPRTHYCPRKSPRPRWSTEWASDTRSGLGGEVRNVCFRRKSECLPQMHGITTTTDELLTGAYSD
jgi:hypothetical protein